MRGIDEAGRLGVGSRQVDLDVASSLGDLRRDPDVVATMTVIVEKGLALKHTVFPARNHGTRLLLGGIKDRLHRCFDDGLAELGEQPRQPAFAEMGRADHRREIAAEFPGIADVQRQQVEEVVAQAAGL